MKNTILFDMDGVIIDSEPLNLAIIASLYDKVGITVPEEVHLGSLGIASYDWWKRIKQDYPFEGYSIDELVAMERKAIDDYIFSPEAKDYIFEGLTEAVKALKKQGYKLGVASASAYPVINQVLKLADLTETFDLVVSATDSKVKRGKPYPDIFLFAAEKLGARPQECLVIEDSELGLKAAKAAGMQTLAFLSAPKPINTENADQTFDDYADFIKIVNTFI